MVLLNQTRLQKGELAVNFRLYRMLFYYQPCPAWQLQKRVRLSILAFGLPNLGFTAVLLLLIQHGFLFYDLLSTLPKVGGRQRRPL